MELDLDALERIAQAATPGPWEIEAPDRYFDRELDTLRVMGAEERPGQENYERYLIVDGSYAMDAGGFSPPDADHIAAFDPTTVLALIARVRELEAIVNDGGNQAAKYWTRLTAAEREMHARELHHFEEEKLRAEAEAERDRYRAAIETARDHEWSGYGKSDTWHILTRALNDGEAEK